MPAPSGMFLTMMSVSLSRCFSIWFVNTCADLVSPPPAPQAVSVLEFGQDLAGDGLDVFAGHLGGHGAELGFD